MSEDRPFFLSHNASFIKASAADELLHAERNAAVKADSLTETQYFGFCIPEKTIHAYCYLWHHPNLHVVSGGLFVWQGHKTSVTHSELCDYRMFMNETVIASDLHNYRLPNGYGVEVLEPLRRHRLTYSDAVRKNSVDLLFDGLIAPIMYADGNHFEQPMKVQGTLTLRGVSHSVECYTVRDRSWGKPRPEENLPMPPLSWAQGVFTDNFAFTCTVMDQASGNPELHGTPIALPEPRTLSGGWILKEGKLGALTTVRKRAVRLAGSRVPRYIELVLDDNFGRQVRIHGTSVASNAWMPWCNLYMPIVLMRWECDGEVAYGDCQEGLWNDYLNLPLS